MRFIIVSIALISSTLAFAEDAATGAPAPTADAAAAAPAPAAAVKAVNVAASGTHDCNKEPDVAIAKGKLKLALTGTCNSVTIKGGNNNIVADGIKTLEVDGASNTLVVSRLDAATLKGAKNQLTWTGTIDSSKTEAAITTTGKGNVVKKGEQAVIDAAKKVNTKSAKKAVGSAKKQVGSALKGFGVKIP